MARKRMSDGDRTKRRGDVIEVVISPTEYFELKRLAASSQTAWEALHRAEHREAAWADQCEAHAAEVQSLRDELRRRTQEFEAKMPSASGGVRASGGTGVYLSQVRRDSLVEHSGRD